MKLAYAFLAGSYVTVALTTFFITAFFCLLGGQPNDLWKPFVYGIFWPITIPLILTGRLS